VERVIRRTKGWDYDPRDMMAKLFSFHAAMAVERVHPLEGGLFRRKHRRDRRAGMPVETRLSFYPRHAWDTLTKYARLGAMYWRYRRILKRVVRETASHDDVAMMPVADGDFDALEMFTATQAARSAVDKQRRYKAAARRA
jgi:hypothetical protein